MKKNTTLALYNSLVQSDFFLLNTNSLKNIPYVNTRTNLKTLINFSALELVTLLKSVKQFIRLLQFLQNDFQGVLYIFVENKHYLNLLKEFFVEYPLNIQINIEQTLPVIHSGVSQKAQMILVLNNCDTNADKVLKKLYKNNIFLINKMNSKLETNNRGTYKIYNDLFDYKKILFLAVLINQVLKKN